MDQYWINKLKIKHDFSFMYCFGNKHRQVSSAIDQPWWSSLPACLLYRVIIQDYCPLIAVHSSVATIKLIGKMKGSQRSLHQLKGLN